MLAAAIGLAAPVSPSLILDGEATPRRPSARRPGGGRRCVEDRRPLRGKLSRGWFRWPVVALLAIQALASAAADGADNLRLGPGLGFTDDSSADFPIRGENLDAVESRSRRPTVVFFGASHCWNTNREAERLVAVYPKYRDRVSFVIIDVARPSRSQVPLLETYCRGSIPTLVILGRDGDVLYARAGETARTRGDTQALDALLLSAVAE